MSLKLNEKYLISVKGWFLAPNGEEYQAVHGTFIAEDEDAVRLGNTSLQRKNIVSVIKCSECNCDEAETWETHDGKMITYQRPSKIYDADDA